MRLGIGMRLFELRKEHEKNTKTPTMDKLREYSNTNGLSVNFSTIKKVGVHPLSTWNTPNGVYAFQLDGFKDDLYDMDSIDDVFPYGTDRPYIFILETTAKSPLNFDENIPSSEFDRYVQMVVQQYGVSKGTMEFYLNARSLKTNTQLLYYFTRQVIIDDKAKYRKKTYKSTNEFNKILRTFGFDAVIDNGHGVMFGSIEPTQMVYLTPSAYNVKDVLHNDALDRFYRQRHYGRGDKPEKTPPPNPNNKNEFDDDVPF
jgi:hypothetical protein